MHTKAAVKRHFMAVIIIKIQARESKPRADKIVVKLC